MVCHHANDTNFPFFKCLQLGMKCKDELQLCNCFVALDHFKVLYSQQSTLEV